MSGVYIKGMEMPDYGYVCLKVFANGDVFMTKMKRGALLVTGMNERIGTAVPVPDHGRLIDADAMEKEVCGGCKHGEHKYENCIDCALANAPTVIPADKEKEHG